MPYKAGLVPPSEYFYLFGRHLSILRHLWGQVNIERMRGSGLAILRRSIGPIMPPCPAPQFCALSASGGL